MILCDYGCGLEATHQFKNGKWCCSSNTSKCPSKRKLFSNNRKGIKFSKEHRDNLSKSHKGQSGYWTGKKRDKETIRKFSEAKLGKSPWNKDLKNCYTEETIKKMSESSKGFVHTDDSKNKISEKLKGKKQSIEHIEKLRQLKIGKKIHTKKTKKIISMNTKHSISKIKKKYPLFSKIEEMRYNPVKPDEKEIQVHCKYHECKNSKEHGDWFTPSGRNISERIYALERDDGSGGLYFYCSNKCKEECPLYAKRTFELIKLDQIRAGIIKEEYYTYEEKQIFNKEVLKRADDLCEYCGQPAEHVHHIRPQKLEPFFSLDPDYGVACCSDCHYKYGHETGTECSTGQLAQTVCI